MAFNPQYTSVGDRYRARQDRREAEKEAERRAWKDRQDDLLFQLRLNEASAKAEERATKKRQERESQERKDRYQELQMLEADVDSFLSKDFENPQERQNQLEILKSRYSGDQRIQAVMEAAVNGREDIIPSVIMRVEEDLMKRGEIDPVERQLAVTQSGKIAPIPKGSSRYMRDLNEHERYALDQGVDPNTPEFETFTKMHRDGKFDEIEVIVPGRGPQMMEKWQAESLGLQTAKQYDWQQKQDANKRAKTQLEAEERQERQRMQAKAQSFKTESGVALENAQKAISLLEIASQSGIDPTDPKSLLESGYEQFGSRRDITKIREELNSFLTSVKSNVVLDKMESMRAQSASGATGFGSMQEKELELLTGALGKLDVEGNTTQGLLDSLRTVQRILDKANSGFIPGEVQTLNTKNPWGADEGAKVMFMGGDPDDPDNWEIM